MKKNNIAIMIVVGYPSTMKIEINYPPITFTIRVYANKQSLNILYIYIRNLPRCFDITFLLENIYILFVLFFGFTLFSLLAMVETMGIKNNKLRM